MSKSRGTGPTPDEFNAILPRTINAEMDEDTIEKRGSTVYTGGTGMMYNAAIFQGTMGNQSIYRNPARRFYDPETTTTAIYLPRNFKQKNRWNRWFYDHDELVGAVLDVHAELPYSKAEILCDDKVIQAHVEECLDRTNFYTMLPLVDLEYMKIGEVFIHTVWDNEAGMWSHIVIHNPDFIDVKYSPFADQESVIELMPDEELRSLVHSTKPEEQQLKKRLPKEVVRRVLTGKNIVLNPEEVTHIARRSNPYDERGTSIITRLHRCYIPNTKVRMFDGTCKEIKDIVSGDFVLSLHGEKRKVLDTVQYVINDKIVEITPEKSSGPLKSTIGHEYLIQRAYCACGCGTALTYKQITSGTIFIHSHNLKFNSNRINNGSFTEITAPIYEIKKIAAEDIKKGDRLLVPINNEFRPCTLTENQARLLGYYIAEGDFCNECGKQPGIEFTFGNHEIDTWVSDVIYILENDFNIKPNVYQGYHGKNICWIKIVKKADYEKLAEFLNTHIRGRRSWNKEFLEDVLYYPKNIQKQILIGAFRGDASKNKKYTETWYNTTSKNLAEQIQWLLFRCSYYSYIKYVDYKPRIVGNNSIESNFKRLFLVKMTGIYAKNFIKDCWNNYKVFNMINKDIFYIINDLRKHGHSYTYIAKELNSLGYVGVEGGNFFNKTVKSIFKNKGSICKNYQFSRDSITHDSEYFYIPVKNINIYNYSGTVHDITVETNHWWLGDGCYVTSNTLMYEDKLREAQLSVSDNFIYPLKIFKLGDPQKGWIPNETHQKALAQMLQQAHFDPNFSLIYHYGLQVEYVTVADKVMRLEKEWNDINERKMVALGVSKQFLGSEGSYSSANVGLQIQLARYRAKRDLFELRWIRDKFFKVMAERNEWYKRDAREIVGQFRVKRTGAELKERLITPEIVWHKKLMMRDDQQYLTFLNNVYSQGKGPLSAVTLLMSMGLDLQDELRKKHAQKKLEEQLGEYIHTPMPGPAGPPATLTAKIKDRLFGRSKESEEVVEPTSKTAQSLVQEKQSEDREFVGAAEIPKKAATAEKVEKKESSLDSEIAKDIIPISDDAWIHNIKSPNVPKEAVNLLQGLDTKLQSIYKKYGNSFGEGVTQERAELSRIITDLYLQGKFTAYSYTNFLPIYREHYAVEGSLRDYSDLILSEEFDSWMLKFSNMQDIDVDARLKRIRDLGATCYEYGQLKGFQEQGIHNVKLFNVARNDGLRYRVDELLSKGMNLSSIVAPDGEIAIFSACIEGFDDPDFGNRIDPRIERTRTYTTAGIRIHDCPVEFIPYIDRFLSKLGKVAKAKYDEIFFVKDVIDLDEWEADQTKKLESKYQEMSKKDRDFIISNSINMEKLQKRGKVASLPSGRRIFISSWIGMEDTPITKKLIDVIDLSGEYLEKTVMRSFKGKTANLSQEELNTYRVFKYIDPIIDNTGTLVGWEASHKVSSADMPDKIRVGDKWDISGRNVTARDDSPITAFQQNVYLWLDYPHKLSFDLLQNFEGIRNG